MLYKLKKKAIGTSHSKIILIGEHAVVYGKPAIALPFPTLNVTTIIEETGEPVHVKTRLLYRSFAQSARKNERDRSLYERSG